MKKAVWRRDGRGRGNTQNEKKERAEVGGRETNDDYRIPQSFTAFCNILSFTTTNTSWILPVSVTCVKLACKSLVSASYVTIKKAISLSVHTQPPPIRLHQPTQHILRCLINNIPHTRLLWEIPLQPHLCQLALEHVISVQDRMMLVPKNYRELMTDSKSTSDSTIRFWPASSRSTWS